MNTTGEIKGQFLIDQQVSSSVAFYTDSVLDDWLDRAHRLAAGFAKWPYTEARISTTYSSSSEEYEFEGLKADTIRIATLGGKKLDKLNFEDYLLYKENHTGGEERVFTDFGNVVFVNPSIDLSGTLTVYGQFVPASFDATDPDSKTVFSDRAPEAHEAILTFMKSFAAFREKKRADADRLFKEGMSMLETIRDQISAEQYTYHSKDRGMWEHFNVLSGGLEDELLKRNQWY